MNQPKVKYSQSNWDLVTVNPNNKTWDWKDLFCFWGVNIQSIIGFSLIASLYVIYDLNSFVVFFGTLLGSLLVYFFSYWIGKPSQKFGLPFVVLLRSSLGIHGSRIFGLILIIVFPQLALWLPTLLYGQEKILVLYCLSESRKIKKNIVELGFSDSKSK